MINANVEGPKESAKRNFRRFEGLLPCNVVYPIVTLLAFLASSRVFLEKKFTEIGPTLEIFSSRDGCNDQISVCSKIDLSEWCTDAYGGNISTEIFEDPRKNDIDGPSGKTIDLSERIVYDARCTTKMHKTAYYHSIVDCLLPAMPLIASMENNNNRNSVILIDEPLKRFFVDLNLAQANEIISIPEHQSQLIRAKSILAPNITTHSSRYDLAKLCMPAFRKRVIPNSAEYTKGSCQNRTVVYIKRQASKGRYLQGDTELLNAIGDTFPRLHLQILNGDESLLQTKHTLQNARLVVGPHGAGIINCLFCPRDVLLVEITHRHVDGYIWRQNAPILQSSNILYIVYGIQSRNQTIQKNSNIILSKTDIQEIVRLVKGLVICD